MFILECNTPMNGSRVTFFEHVNMSHVYLCKKSLSTVQKLKVKRDVLNITRKFVKVNMTYAFPFQFIF